MKVDDVDAHQQSVEEIEPAVVEVHGEQAGRPSAGGGYGVVQPPAFL
jgi:hypothetical protein